MMGEIVNLTHQIIMQDTQENIEANTATIAEASLAYATDMNQIGIYASGSWIWVASGSGGTSGTFVGARYNSSAGQIIVTGAAQAIIDFDHKVYDTNNAVTSGSAWKFTVPETAYYHIDACAYLSASGSWNVGERVLFNLFASGSTIALLDRKDDDGNSPTASEVTIHGSVTLHLTAGQYLDVRIAQNSGANIALSTDPTQVWINIEMVNGVLPTTGDVVASGSATDGNLAVFDGDIYHIKDGGAPHAAVTIQDTATIDLSLSGQQISADLKNTTVASGSYTNANIVVDSQGRITAASNGSSGSSAGGAATNNPFITSGSSPDLTNYRQLIAGTNISFDTSTPGQLSISAASGSSSGLDASGWASADSMTYVSADAPSYVVSVTGDQSAKYYPGMRVKLTQGGSVKYFGINAVTYISGSSLTNLTLYGGTDYSLSGSAISSPYYSGFKIPAGWNPDPSKWSQELSDTNSITVKSGASIDAWYNDGTLLLAIPLGCWKVQYKVNGRTDSGNTIGRLRVTLSTTNNGESDVQLSAMAGHTLPSGTATVIDPFFVEKTITLTSKTTHYLNFSSSQGGTLKASGDVGATIIRAIWAYL